uniref:Uncharacterized protein n=1 Tax=Strigamia maritima TaxID=126957 RepID=T1J879_STRMM
MPFEQKKIMMHKSPLLFRLTADCTLELPPTRTMSLNQCCFRDDPNRDLSKDFCRFHHLEPAEVDILSETPIWYPKPIILARTNQTIIPSKLVHLKHDEPPVTPIFFKHLVANFKDYLTKIQESFMSEDTSRSMTYTSERSSVSRSRNATPEPSQSASRQTTSQSQRITSFRDSGLAQSIVAGMPRISPTKITEFVKSVWHGFEVMGLTEDNTVG